MKLSEISLGLIDILAVLVPGAVATGVLALSSRAVLGLLLSAEGPPAWVGAAFLLAAWIVGQLIFRLGSGLDTLFDQERQLLVHGPRKSKLYRAADAIRAARVPRLPIEASTYKWAKAWFRVESPETFEDVERLEASSKFFRGMTVCAGVGAGVAWVFPENVAGYAALTGLSEHWFALDLTVLTGLFYRGFTATRTMAIDRAYLGVVLHDARLTESATSPRPTG